METIRNLNRPDRFLSVAIALLTATCAMPPRAWCAGTNLWTSSYGAGVDSYNSIQLKKNGAPTPLELGTYPDANGLAFDSSHNLWVVVFDPDGNLVLEYTAAQLKNLKHDPGPTPAAIISSTGSFEYPLGCNFDFQGNLWIADPENDSIDELSKAQLAAGSGNVTPAVVVGSSIPGRPNFVTFDKAGNAWTGIDNEPNSEIAEFSASQLTGSGIRTPTI